MAVPAPRLAPCAQIPWLPPAAAPSSAAPARTLARPSLATPPCTLDIDSLHVYRSPQTALVSATPIPKDALLPGAPSRSARPWGARSPKYAAASHFVPHRAESR